VNKPKWPEIILLNTRYAPESTIIQINYILLNFKGEYAMLLNDMLRT